MVADADLFQDPDCFRPERYLESPFGTKLGADTRGFRDTFPFGAGRVSLNGNQSYSVAHEIWQRLCPGEQMASRTIVRVCVLQFISSY